MTFQRTAAGLTNIALFHQVNLVVFVEGKEQTKEGDVGSVDLLFWNRIFESFAPNVSVHISCRGSKQSLLSIAAQVTDGKVSNIVVALDRDFDFERGYEIDHPAIIYSYGYSWENDVWTLGTVITLFDEHALVRPVPSHTVKAVSDAHTCFLTQVRRVAAANLAAMVCCGKPVMTTDEYRGLVCRKGKLPQFKNRFFRERLKKFNREKQVKVYLENSNVSAERHGLGHLLAFFGCHLAIAAWESLGQHTRVDFNFLNTTVVNIFCSKLKTGDVPCYDYYLRRFQKLHQLLDMQLDKDKSLACSARTT